MTGVILVEGTHGGQWAQPGSLFWQLLEANGFTPLLFKGWTTDVSGLPTLLGAGPHSDWMAGGYSLGYFLEDIPYENRNILCHSHGLNPVLYQATLVRQPIRRLVSVCSPVRADMQATATAAKPLIGRWRHVADTHGDHWQRLGELFDGHFGWCKTKWPQADENLTIPHIGHTGLLEDAQLIQLNITDGNFDFLHGQQQQQSV